MKKEYEKPLAELIEFQTRESIMDGFDIGDDEDIGIFESVPDEF